MDQELPHPTYDTLFKRMLQDRNRAKASIRVCVPPELAKLITKAPQPLDVRNYTQGGALSECNSLFKVFLDNGQYILVMFEHKSSPDPRTLEQICKYLFALHFGGLADNEGCLSDLPVAPIVYYHRKEAWKTPESTIEGKWEMPVLGYPYSVKYQFVTPAGLETSELEKNANLCSAVTIQRLLHMTDAKVTDSELELIAKQFAGSGFGKYLCICAMEMLNVDERRFEKLSKRVLPEEENVMPTVAEQIELKGLTKGREQGQTEGRMEGRTDALLDLLKLKFSSVQEERLEQVKTAGLEELVNWSSAVLTAESIDEVFAVRAPT